jgi:uncharacterized protein (TIGR02391 family)
VGRIAGIGRSNKMSNMKNKGNDVVLNKMEKIYKWFRIVFVLLGPIYIFGVTVYKGINSFGLEIFQALILGFFLALIVFGLLLLVDFGLLAWDKTTTWLTKELKKRPKARRVIISFLTTGITLGSFYISIFYWNWDNLSRFIFFVYFGVFLPAALFSILKDEKTRETSRLSNQITPELIVNNPQAAIEHAFTLFEEHLRKRIGAGSEVYGEALINQAFAPNGRLVYSNIESENKGVRNFVSGAYAIYRNPRKHRIIQDDEQTTSSIIRLVELLFQIVDESKNQSSTPENLAS